MGVGFGEYLVREGLLSETALWRALTARELGGGRVDTALLELGLMREATLLKALGAFHRTRIASGAELERVGPDVARLISPRVARRYELVPLRLAGKKLAVASLDPGDLLAEDEVALLTGCLVSSHVALEVRLYEALARLYGAQRSARLVAVSRRLASGGITLAATQPTAPAGSSAAPAEPSEDVQPGADETPERELVPGAMAWMSSPPRREMVTSPSWRVRAPGTSPHEVDETDLELEISDEDLELFPSLRGEGGADDDEHGITSAERALETLAPAEPAAGVIAPRRRLEPQSSEAPESEDQEDAAVGAGLGLMVPAGDLVIAAPIDHEAIDQPDHELRLIAASTRLVDAEMREDIGDALLGYCAPLFTRRMLLILRRDHVLGWRGEGDGVDQSSVRGISIPLEAPSVFMGLTKGMGFWLGSLPSIPGNTELISGLGDPKPEECLVLPVLVKTKVVCFLYGDNGAGPLGDFPMPQLRRLVTKAGVAFQVYILKSKIRTM